MDECFVLNDISKEQFEKYSQKYEREKRILKEENSNGDVISLNLEKAVEKCLDIVQNISEIWCSGGYAIKQKLQYLIFSEGILCNKKNDTVRTLKTNSLFSLIPYQTRVSAKNKKDSLLQDCLFGSKVGMTTDSSNLIMQDIFSILSH